MPPSWLIRKERKDRVAVIERLCVLRRHRAPGSRIAQTGCITDAHRAYTCGTGSARCVLKVVQCSFLMRDNRGDPLCNCGLLQRLVDILFDILWQAEQMEHATDANALVVNQARRARHAHGLRQQLSSPKHRRQEGTTLSGKEGTLPPGK